MEQEHDWQYDLDEYIRQGEPDRSEKSDAWQTAIGLQDFDGLQTSEYLLETAKERLIYPPHKNEYTVTMRSEPYV